MTFLVMLAAGSVAAQSTVIFINQTAESGFLSLEGHGGHGIQVADVDGDGVLCQNSALLK